MTNWMMLGAAAVAVVAIGSLILPKGAAGYDVRAIPAAELASSNALVVDIRSAGEWAQSGVIEGAKLVTFSDAESFLAAIKGDLTEGRPLVLICHSGRRSAAAAGALAGKITNPVTSYQGGMAAWIGAGNKVIAAK